nr:alpha/beta hydrolase [Hymenobacter volaticus]
MVITEAGNNPKVAGLLYVAALIPNDGQSLVDVVQNYSPAPGNAEVQADAAGFQKLSMQGIHQDFAQDVPVADRNVMHATQVPWAKQALTEKIAQAAWKTRPSWCVIASADRMINPELERAEAKLIKATTLELNTSHVPMVSEPNKVAAFILAATQKLGASQLTTRQPAKRR